MRVFEGKSTTSDQIVCVVGNLVWSCDYVSTVLRLKRAVVRLPYGGLGQHCKTEPVNDNQLYGWKLL